MSNITVQDLVTQLQKSLELEYKSGEQGSQRVIQSSHVSGQQDFSLVGHLNIIHPNKIQVLGQSELEYLDKQGKNSRHDFLIQLYTKTQTSLILITEGAQVPSDFLILSDKHNIPLFTCHASSHEAINRLHYLLSSLLADSLIIHGVFMEVMGNGVLLTGDSGIGKSELALDLISRGHRLIADDTPQFSKITPDIINGSCPVILREFLEVRGLGVLNIRAIFGDSAVKTNKYLRLIIALKNVTVEQLQKMDRLRGSKRNRKVLGINIPEITLPVAPGRNLAIAVETAVRNHILLQKGYDAAEDFIQRQNRLVQKGVQ